jgi:hypothetical protein
MPPAKTKVEMPGVAKDQELSAIPTGDEVSAMDRVNALLHGSVGDESDYDVKIPYLFLQVLQLISF